ncbi:MAG: hypothetical protein GX856_01700 [Gammaproteobacteria bacterium]|nr:hypothetical protein [Gammaproteobacteria bacterium]
MPVAQLDSVGSRDHADVAMAQEVHGREPPRAVAVEAVRADEVIGQVAGDRAGVARLHRFLQRVQGLPQRRLRHRAPAGDRHAAPQHRQEQQPSARADAPLRAIVVPLHPRLLPSSPRAAPAPRLAAHATPVIQSGRYATARFVAHNRPGGLE